MFPQKRIQNHKPAAGSVTQKKVQRQIDAFVENVSMPKEIKMQIETM
jgi:hypothetical protein